MKRKKFKKTEKKAKFDDIKQQTECASACITTHIHQHLAMTMSFASGGTHYIQPPNAMNGLDQLQLESGRRRRRKGRNYLAFYNNNTNECLQK